MVTSKLEQRTTRPGGVLVDDPHVVADTLRRTPCVQHMIAGTNDSSPSRYNTYRTTATYITNHRRGPWKKADMAVGRFVAHTVMANRPGKKYAMEIWAAYHPAGCGCPETRDLR